MARSLSTANTQSARRREREHEGERERERDVPLRIPFAPLLLFPVLPSRPLPFARSTSYLVQVIDGLEYTERSDVYSLGIVLSEAITLTLPFDTERKKGLFNSVDEFYDRIVEGMRPGDCAEIIAAAEAAAVRKRHEGTLVDASASRKRSVSTNGTSSKGVTLMLNLRSRSRAPGEQTESVSAPKSTPRLTTILEQSWAADPQVRPTATEFARLLEAAIIPFGSNLSHPAAAIADTCTTVESLK